MEHITDLLDSNQKRQAQSITRSASATRSNNNNNNNIRNSSTSIGRSTDTSMGLNIREDPKTGIFVEGLTQVHVKSKDQLLQFVKQGMRKRQVN